MQNKSLWPLDRVKARRMQSSSRRDGVGNVSRRRNNSDILTVMDYSWTFLLAALGRQWLEEEPGEVREKLCEPRVRSQMTCRPF